jgi:hypothetical protein
LKFRDREKLVYSLWEISNFDVFAAAPVKNRNPSLSHKEKSCSHLPAEVVTRRREVVVPNEIPALSRQLNLRRRPSGPPSPCLSPPLVRIKKYLTRKRADYDGWQMESEATVDVQSFEN